MPSKVLIDDRLYEPQEATISVFDRGFLYGDSVYEVVRTYGGRPFALAAHRARLEHSAAALTLALPPPERLRDGLRRAVEAAIGGTGEEAYARIVVTRGAGEIGLDPALGDGPRLVIFAKPLQPPDPRLYEEGAAIAIVGVRRNPRRAIDPGVKSGNYLNNILALAEARRAGAYEAVMLDAEGYVTEGSTSNYFLVAGGALRTPALDVGILEGITRGVVLRLGRAVGLAVEEGRIRPDELVTADEVFLTSTIRGVLPVSRIDGHVVGSGRPGPIARRIASLYDAEAIASASW